MYKKSNNITVIPVTNKLVDIFWGRIGWKTHTRVRKGHNGGLSIISGADMPASVARESSTLIGW